MRALEEIDTPLGKGILLGISCDGNAACVQHPRPENERDRTHGPTFIKWWAWSGEKIVGELDE